MQTSGAPGQPPLQDEATPTPPHPLPPKRNLLFFSLIQISSNFEKKTRGKLFSFSFISLMGKSCLRTPQFRRKLCGGPFGRYYPHWTETACCLELSISRTCPSLQLREIGFCLECNLQLGEVEARRGMKNTCVIRVHSKFIKSYFTGGSSYRSSVSHSLQEQFFVFSPK